MGKYENLQAPTIFGNNYQSSDASSSTTKPSRLSNTTQEIREGLLSRNLYGQFNNYPLDQNTSQKVVEAVSNVINTVMPFKSINLEDTVYGRLITNPTPLTEIGLIMLGKQFAMNAASNIAQQTFPVFKASNLFDGNRDTKLFEFGKNFSITKQEDIGFLTKITNIVSGRYPKKNYDLTNLDDKNRNTVLIKNTGEGQLDTLFKNLNRNIFKEFNKPLQDAADSTKNEFVSGYISALRNDRNFFNFTDRKFNPYNNFFYMGTIVDESNANNVMMQTYATQYDDPEDQEYGSDLQIFGSAIKFESNIEIESEFKTDPANTIVWGRDGTTYDANQRIGILRGDEEAPETGSEINFQNKYNVKTGLLEYTRNLLNATGGKHVDITKKVYEINDSQYRIDYGFQGSGLWRANNSKYAKASGTANKRGVRQHTPLDPYDKFTKAIRFNGNKVFENYGSKNSVIGESVMPRIHPTLKLDGSIDNKNLMFSIENLAVRTVLVDGSGFIDDDRASYIPPEEVGPFNGRIMWFPPYNIEFNETATAKYESTVMVGRNEPIYSYINSERSVNLNWYMLIDYPPQLKNFKGSASDRYKAIVDFFAFGGDKLGNDKIVRNYDEEIEKLENQIEEIKGVPEEVKESEPIKPNPVSVYFPNDLPNSGNITTIIDEMYSAGYEVANNMLGNAYDTTNYGKNKDIFTKVGISGSAVNPATFKVLPTWTSEGSGSQYTTTGDNKLNSALRQVFDDDTNWGYYKFTITAGASKLYQGSNESSYNLALSQRRVDAVKELITRRLYALYPNAPKAKINQILEFETKAEGSDVVNDSNISVSASVEGISVLSTKEERSATIVIQRNSKNFPRKDITLTSEQQAQIKKLNEQIENLKTLKNQQKTVAKADLLNERKVDFTDENAAGNSAILKNGETFTENYYSPVYHSQTPEEFHRRLTFLQQCVRQGAAERYDMTNENGFLRAKNSVFGRQPVCILRIGDFFYTKVIIESINVDYSESPWDMNPEGFGMQPMLAKITTQMKLIGGQSLKGPIDALQNAVAFNYYANSTFSNTGIYEKPAMEEKKQMDYLFGVDNDSVKSGEGLLGVETEKTLEPTAINKLKQRKFLPEDYE